MKTAGSGSGLTEWSRCLGACRIASFLVAVSLVLISECVTSGSTIRHDQSDTDYLDLGLLPEYESVGSFVNSWGFSGSAILIAPDWVLTGAHVFTAADSGTFTLLGSSYDSTQLFSHPNWNGNNEFAGYDFGLARLSSPVEGVTPATLYAGSSEVGEIGSFVGYGLTGTGLTGYRTLDNKKRAFQNVIDGNFGLPSVLLGSDFDNPLSATDNDFGSPIPLDFEGAVAPGDSGGGVFITEGSTTYLAGVTSFVAGRDGRANADYGDVTGFGRVSAVLPWITGVMIPEPSAMILVPWGFALLCWRTARRSQAASK